jgi:anti-sigma regulatory factor (Ser/Thr protein kinase)
MDVRLPNSLEPASLAAFAIELHELPIADEYIFDFGNKRRFPPFSMLFLASVLRSFRDARPDARRGAVNHENHGYAAHLGFFKSFGLNHGNSPGAAIGSERYIPISEYSVAEIKSEASDNFQETGDVIEKKATELAEILTQQEAGVLQDTLTYSIREIIRNVVEHSEADTVFVCAQYWPQLEQVEVGIVDNGIGIHAALTQNPAHEGLTEDEALELALMPGISGNPFAGKGRDVWNNSGYGLYMTSRICRNGGNFLICSGGHGIDLTHEHGKQEIKTDFQGTAIRLFINTKNMKNLTERLAEFREQGRETARFLKGANDGIASKASQMLRRDFEVE